MIIWLFMSMNKPLKVAILDTGIQKEKIESKIIFKDFVQEKSRSNTHGTEMAKIIELDNNIVIYNAKVLNHDGIGTVDDTIAGIDWAIENKVNVVSMSYGFTHDYQKLHKKIKEAANKGIIIIAANGNDIFGQKEYPALYQETISIGVLDKDYTKSIFNSNDYADMYINLNGVASYKVNNTSEATAVVTNHLLKVYDEDFMHTDKNEIVHLVYKSVKNR